MYICVAVVQAAFSFWSWHLLLVLASAIASLQAGTYRDWAQIEMHVPYILGNDVVSEHLYVRPLYRLLSASGPGICLPVCRPERTGTGPKSRCIEANKTSLPLALPHGEVTYVRSITNTSILGIRQPSIISPDVSDRIPSITAHGNLLLKVQQLLRS
jgi:hypothetical protein